MRVSVVFNRRELRILLLCLLNSLLKNSGFGLLANVFSFSNECISLARLNFARFRDLKGLNSDLFEVVVGLEVFVEIGDFWVLNGRAFSISNKKGNLHHHLRCIFRH